MNNFAPQKVLELKKELSKRKPNLFGNYYITPKIDGWFVSIFFNGERWETPKSSTNRYIPSLVHIRDELNKLPKLHSRPFMLIAEAIVPNTPFHILNGLLNRKSDCNDVVFYVHDLLYINADVPADARLDNLFALRLPNYSDRFIELRGRVHPYIEKEWQRRFDEAIDNGDEGIVAKQLDSLYSYGGRNSTLVKMKLECERDLLCEQVVCEIGDKGNPSTSLILLNKQNVRTKVVVNSHEVLKLIDTTNVIGNVVKVKAMVEMRNGVLRQPVFSCFRFDKEAKDID